MGSSVLWPFGGMLPTPASLLLRWAHAPLQGEVFKEGLHRGDRGTNIHLPLGAEQRLRRQGCFSAAPRALRSISPSLADQVLSLKRLPLSLGPLAANVLRVLPISATVSQDSGPGLAAPRGQGPHLTPPWSPQLRAWLTLDVQEYMLSEHGTNEDTGSHGYRGRTCRWDHSAGYDF